MADNFRSGGAEQTGQGTQIMNKFRLLYCTLSFVVSVLAGCAAPDVLPEILEYQENKFIMPDERYAWKIRNQYRDNFVQKGIELAKQLQQKEIDNKC